MKKITIAYFGSPDFSANFLEKLLIDKGLSKTVEVKCVVTQEDRLSGRKQVLTATPVKKITLKHKIKTIEIEKFKLRDSIKIEELKALISSIDISLVFAYAGLIPEELLNTPKHGFWCIHPSLLPKYRGTSPMATALINGDKETGVTIIKMDERIDHGPIIDQKSLTIENSDKRPDLEKKLTNLAFEMFKKLVLTNLNNLQLIKQDDSLVTFTKKLDRQNGFIEFGKLKQLLKLVPSHLSASLKAGQSLVTFYNLYRGLYSWPGIWTILPNGKRLKITNMELGIIKKVQLEGKNEVGFETFNKAYKIL